MAQSGAARHLGESGAMARLGAVPAVPSWLRPGNGVRGPLLTLVVTIVLDQLARHAVPVAQPFPALLLTVVYSGYTGGSRAGVLSAVLTVLYALHFLSHPGQILSYPPSAAVSLLLVGVAAPALAFLGARLGRSRDSPVAAGLSRPEAEALNRRLSLLSAAGETLTTAPDSHAAFRDFARLTVPALADWSMIHLATGDGPLQYVAGAHREPTRDLLVTALAEYGHARLPFGGPVNAAELAEVTDDGLQAVAEDEEQLRLYRALEPRALMRLPVRSRGRVVGVVTLGVSRPWGRRVGTGELAFAEELVSRAALAMDNLRLRQETEDGRRRFQLLFEANPLPMWVFDAETLRFLAVNRAAVSHYGYSRAEFLSMTIMDIRPPDDTPGLNATLERGPHPGDSALTQHQGKDGRLLDMELISETLQFGGRRARLVLATDISDRTRTRAALQQTEDQLRQVQRLDTMGRLASGVAYDFNNLLTTIHGFSDLLLRDLPADDGRRADVQQIRRAADRGALLARQLTAFGGKPAMPPRPLSLNEIVGDLNDLLQRLMGADVRLETRLAHGLPQVRMDQGQLEQIILNLALNARDAMLAGGTLTIETTERQISASVAGRVRPGWYVVLGVSDTGRGMDEEALAHTFEPSYGSPASGDRVRSGLGLSIVYGIVRRAGGVIRVSSEPGTGTTVKLYLPSLDTEETPAEIGRTERGSGTVLVAEDEEGVRRLIRKLLEEQGYNVLDARHGKDALLTAAAATRPIDLLVTDVVMPEMNGPELVEALAGRYPDLKVLYVSGYTNEEVLRRGVTGSNPAFVQKPFTADDLMREVRRLLESPHPATETA